MGNYSFTVKIPEFDYGSYTKIVLGVCVSLYTLNSLYEAQQYKNTNKQGIMRKQLRDQKSFEFQAIQFGKVEKILASDIKGLKALLEQGEVTSEDLVNVYGQRCYTIGRNLGLVTEEYYTEAIQEARKRDEERQEAKKNKKEHKLGLLHGIPVSIKDHIDEKGKLNTCGCTFLANHIAQEDALVVQMLKDQGAIMMVRGNVPQFMFLVHTDNNVYGLAKNPYNQKRTCGGSSGGDCGLVSARCVPLAIGSDIGGSIRNPASFVGVCGFLPTPMRMSTHGLMVPVNERELPQSCVLVSPGPIAQSVDDLVLAMKSFWQQKMFEKDLSVSPFPFNTTKYDNTLAQNSLRIGYFDSLPNLPSTSSVKRSIQIAIQALENKGHILVPFQINSCENYTYFEIFMQNASFSSVGQIIETTKKNHEPVIAPYQAFFKFYQLSPLMKKLVLSFLNVWEGKRITLQAGSFRDYNQFEIDEILRTRNAFCTNILNKWTNLKIDALICPVYPTCAFKNADAEILGSVGDYTYLWNILNYPAGTVPITEVQEKEDEDEIYEDKYNDRITKAIRRTIQENEGMPLGVQVVTQTWEDEKCLAVMKILDSAVDFRKQRFDIAPQQFEIVKAINGEDLIYLLDLGVFDSNYQSDLNFAINSDGLTPLMVVKLLKEHNVYYEFSENGISPLHLACKTNNIDVVKYFIETMDKDPREENPKNPRMTPLSIAMARGHQNLCQYLISKGATISKDMFYLACKNGNVSLIEFIISELKEKLGMTKEQLEREVYNGNFEKAQSTPLFRSCVNGNLEVVKYLIEKLHVTVDTLNMNDENCLIVAARNKHIQLVQYICKKSIKPTGPIDINHECKRNGLTVLARTILSGQFMIAEVLIKQGNADIDYINKMCEKSILEIAIDQRNFKAIDYLLNQADVKINVTKLEKDYGFTVEDLKNGRAKIYYENPKKTQKDKFMIENMVASQDFDLVRKSLAQGINSYEKKIEETQETEDYPLFSQRSVDFDEKLLKPTDVKKKSTSKFLEVGKIIPEAEETKENDTLIIESIKTQDIKQFPAQKLESLEENKLKPKTKLGLGHKRIGSSIDNKQLGTQMKNEIDSIQMRNNCATLEQQLRNSGSSLEEHVNVVIHSQKEPSVKANLDRMKNLQKEYRQKYNYRAFISGESPNIKPQLQK